ncbi:cyclase family protein [Micromonospora parathelypteridis]|uniref:Kynurenine formamidase n=1 Tax=Micromonospora parathelypteridis TaxID=1839617 RepID=A0A840VTU5_9ACTN|nr:cyclase family protein [Micromonospora parathelypteridis]MBB5480703.1 kynurenine formamidase [Micromonospora parathelypteridis]GGO22076.1 cyclase [Micromonospora parathelypteridis]
MTASPGLASVLASLSAGKVYDLAQTLQTGMACSPNHPGFRMALQRRHGDQNRADGTSSASELIITGGHVGTHIDALSHFSDAGCLHGGVDAAAAQQTGRFTKHGAETIPPFLRRGVLLDVAATAGVEVLAPGVSVDTATLQTTAAAAGVEVRAGDIVLVRTGWSRHFADPQRFLGIHDGVPGITTDAAAWLADTGVVAVGGDTTSVEQISAGQGHSLLPVHRLLLVERGIYLIEMLDLEKLAADNIAEFLFVAIPLKILGGTGSPLRPLAVTAQ